MQIFYIIFWDEFWIYAYTHEHNRFILKNIYLFTGVNHIELQKHDNLLLKNNRKYIVYFYVLD